MMQIEVNTAGGSLASERNGLSRRGASLLIDSEWISASGIDNRRPRFDFNHRFQDICRFDGT
jgi:hypothetical protein